MKLELLHLADFWFWFLLTFSVLISIIYIVKYKYKYRLLYIFRLAILLILLFGLFQPKIINNTVKERQKKIKIFIDNSMSISYHSNHSLTKINSEIEYLKNNLDKKSINYTTYLFDKKISAPNSEIKLNGDGLATNLGSIIKESE